MAAASGSDGLQYSLDGGPFFTNPSFGGLAVGSYTVVVSDALGCRDSLQVVLPGTEAPQLINIELRQARCGEADGALRVLAESAAPPLRYRLNSGPLQPDPSFDGLAAGDYLLTVEDADGCATTQLLTVPGSELLRAADPQITPADCELANGAVLFQITESNGPVVRIDSSGRASPELDIVGLPFGEYRYTLEDTLGCTLEVSVRVPGVDCGVRVPNAFTPGQAGEDAVFEVVPHPQFRGQLVRLRVYNRWGAEVHNTADGSSGRLRWDGTQAGTPLVGDVYVYRVDWLEEDGRANYLQGDVTLLR